MPVMPYDFLLVHLISFEENFMAFPLSENSIIMVSSFISLALHILSSVSDIIFVPFFLILFVFIFFIIPFTVTIIR